MQIGDIFYGIDLFATDRSIEIYQVTSIEYYNTYYDVSVEVIIGDTGIFRFPNDWDPNELLTGYYSNKTIWIYSKNIEALVDLNEKILNGHSAIEDISLKAWSVWDNEWINLSPSDL